MNPFGWIRLEWRVRVFVFAAAGAVLLMACMQLLGRALVTDAAPAGIVSYEFAGSLPAARAILDSWDAAARVRAGLSLGLDYLFLVLYAVAIGLGCTLVASALELRTPFAARAGLLLGWGVLAAALLDALENYALIRLLLGSAGAIWPAVASSAAGPKFALVALGLLYVLAGGIASAFLRRRGISP